MVGLGIITHKRQLIQPCNDRSHHQAPPHRRRSSFSSFSHNRFKPSDIPLIASIPDAITQQKLSGIQEMVVKRWKYITFWSELVDLKQ